MVESCLLHSINLEQLEVNPILEGNNQFNKEVKERIDWIVRKVLENESATRLTLAGVIITFAGVLDRTPNKDLALEYGLPALGLTALALLGTAEWATRRRLD